MSLIPFHPKRTRQDGPSGPEGAPGAPRPDSATGAGTVIDPVTGWPVKRDEASGSQGDPSATVPAIPYVEFEDVTKTYGSGTGEIRALDGASFTVRRGEFAVVLGASGAGKTTALNILGGMDTATSGRVAVGGRDITHASETELVEYRRRDVGFVFQFYNLVPNLTALENVELASQICPNALDARETLDKVGLGERLANFPAQLSGGEQQRVSIARALAKNPKLLLCDEPTGALDYNTGKQILQLLQDSCRQRGITVALVTHNSALAPMGDRLIRFRSGKVTEITANPNPTPIADIEW